MVEDNIVRLPPSRAMPVLKQKLNGYRSSCNRIYIGLTANPEARWERHQGDGWIKMAVLYEAYNVEIGQDLERELIDYARRCNFIEPPENIGSGGEGVLDQNGHHYLYVLVA